MTCADNANPASAGESGLPDTHEGCCCGRLDALVTQLKTNNQLLTEIVAYLADAQEPDEDEPTTYLDGSPLA